MSAERPRMFCGYPADITYFFYLTFAANFLYSNHSALITQKIKL